MALSLRRYIPSAFEDISFRRCVLDLSLVTAGYTVCSYVGMEVALDNTKLLRKNLIKQSEIFENMRKERIIIFRKPRIFDPFT